jgi:hypothetical protein
MGITKNCSKFLAFAKTKGVSFSETLTLGRQILYVTKEEASAQLDYFKIPHAKFEESFDTKFSEPLFRALGAQVIDSMDYSTFENATVIHDLNIEVPNSLKRRYSAIFDGGTLEHVFNFPIAIKNCMDMLKVGGHYIAISPTNNQSGHGFYQFSPELFFSLFDSKYGFKTTLVACGVDIPGDGIKDWYRIENPQHVKKRVTLTNSFPTFIMVIAEKIADTENLILRPIQSDYEFIWNVHHSLMNDTPIAKENRIMYYYRKYTPEILKIVVRKIAGRSSDLQKDIQGFGSANPSFFKKMKV